MMPKLEPVTVSFKPTKMGHVDKKQCPSRKEALKVICTVNNFFSQFCSAATACLWVRLPPGQIGPCVANGSPPLRRF